MEETTQAWDARLDALWKSLDQLQPDDFVARVDAMTAELPGDSAIGLFERACARDSTGHPGLAVPLYQAALAKGISGIRRYADALLEPKTD
jgi:hypothetical protein